MIMAMAQNNLFEWKVQILSNVEAPPFLTVKHVKLNYNYCKHLDKLSLLINYITFARKSVNSSSYFNKKTFLSGEKIEGEMVP